MKPDLASRLRHRVEIQRPAHQPDDSAGQISAWVSCGEFAAEVLPTGGSKTLEGTIVMGVQGWRVRLRWQPGITITHRFIFEGREMAITSIEDPDGNRAELLAFCQTGVPT